MALMREMYSRFEIAPSRHAAVNPRKFRRSSSIASSLSLSSLPPLPAAYHCPLSPSTEIFVFYDFSRAARSKIEGIQPWDRYGLVPDVFLGSGSYGGPGRREKHRFPGRSRNRNFLDVFPKFLNGFLVILPPKLAESVPGTVTSVFPMLFYSRGLPESPGDPRSAEIAHVGPGHSLHAPDIL